MHTKSIILTAALFMAASAFAEPADLCTIAVSGTFTSQVVPDKMNWTINVNESGTELAPVKATAGAKLRTVLDIIKGLGIPYDDVQTGYLSVQRETECDALGRPKFKGWRLCRAITFTQTDLSRFDEFFDKLIGSVEVEASYSFESSKYHEVRKETRLQAIRMAKEKAAAMCAELGVTLGAAQTVSEAGSPYQGGMPWVSSMYANDIKSNGSVAVNWAGSQAAVMGGSMLPGRIEITEAVNVIFRIQ